MIAADPDTIPVAAEYDHMTFGLGQLETGCDRNGPAVKGMQNIRIHKNRCPARTADAADQRQVVNDTQIINRPQKRI